MGLVATWLEILLGGFKVTKLNGTELPQRTELRLVADGATYDDKGEEVDAVEVTLPAGGGAGTPSDTTPAAVDANAAGAGVATTYSRGDHKHAVTNGSLALTKLANIATARILGRTTAGSGAVEELTGTQATALLDEASASAKGLLSTAMWSLLGAITGPVVVGRLTGSSGAASALPISGIASPTGVVGSDTNNDATLRRLNLTDRIVMGSSVTLDVIGSGVRVGAAGAVQRVDLIRWVRVRETANHGLSSSTVDGVVCSTGDLALFTGQSTASQNGIRIYSGSSWDRPVDFASGVVMPKNTVAFVADGTDAGKAYRMSTTSTVTIGTDAQTWTEFGAAGGPGSSISQAGGSVAVDGSGGIDAASADDQSIVLTAPITGGGYAKLDLGDEGGGEALIEASAGVYLRTVGLDGRIEVEDDDVSLFSGGVIGIVASTSITETVGSASRTVTASGANRTETYSGSLTMAVPDLVIDCADNTIQIDVGAISGAISNVSGVFTFGDDYCQLQGTTFASVNANEAVVQSFGANGTSLQQSTTKRYRHTAAVSELRVGTDATLAVLDSSGNTRCEDYIPTKTTLASGAAETVGTIAASATVMKRIRGTVFALLGSDWAIWDVDVTLDPNATATKGLDSITLLDSGGSGSGWTLAGTPSSGNLLLQATAAAGAVVTPDLQIYRAVA